MPLQPNLPPENLAEEIQNFLNAVSNLKKSNNKKLFNENDLQILRQHLNACKTLIKKYDQAVTAYYSSVTTSAICYTLPLNPVPLAITTAIAVLLTHLNSFSLATDLDADFINSLNISLNEIQQKLQGPEANNLAQHVLLAARNKHIELERQARFFSKEIPAITAFGTGWLSGYLASNNYSFFTAVPTIAVSYNIISKVTHKFFQLIRNDSQNPPAEEVAENTHLAMQR